VSASPSSLASTCPEFGVRSQIDMFIQEGAAEVTGDIQRDLLLLA
jgi:hypothetical protein